MIFRPNYRKFKRLRGAVFLWGAIFNFSQKIGLKSIKNMQFCILHKPMGGLESPPPRLRYCLQPLLSIQCMSASRNDTPTQENIFEFSVFDKIFLPSVDADVSLLIERDNRQILKTHSIIKSASGHYATRTPIVWFVNCSKDKYSTH